jgi:PTS system mannose-specific IIA component
MIGLLIVTHGRLGYEIMATLQHIAGVQDALSVIGIAPEDDPEECLNTIRQEIETLDTGKGVIIATDLFGGTPSNLAISLMEPNKIEVMAGVNVPALIKLITIRKEVSIDKAVKMALEAGKKYMILPSEFL